MNSDNITWTCDDLSDVRLLDEIPAELARLLLCRNGWILHHGLLHVRGAVAGPAWHSLRDAWVGEHSFAKQYPEVFPTDLPFAQDLFGDQFLLRNGRVVVLSGETGKIAEKEQSLGLFLQRAGEDPVSYLNGSSNVRLEPGQLMFAAPPFVVKQEQGLRSELKPCPAEEVIGIHADIARQIRDLPNGTQIVIKVR